MQAAILGIVTRIQMLDANEMHESSVVVNQGCRLARQTVVDWQSLGINVWRTRVDVENKDVSLSTARDRA